MEFGYLEDVSAVDFELPIDDPRSWTRLEFLKTPEHHPAIHVGAPVWASKKWLGKIYPVGTSSKDFLRLYSEQYNSIELNTTHYRIPDPATIERWVAETPESFRFCPKFPQEISHHRALVEVEDLTHAFCESVMGLGLRLGLSFLQLPPSFEPRHLPRLERFLRSLPKDFRLAVEFRHEDFFRHHTLRSDAFALLSRFNAATVITDVAGRRDVLHTSLTSNTVLVRFIANDLHPTDFERTEEWVRRLKSWMKLGLETIYFFVHQPGDSTAPELINEFVLRLNGECGFDLKPWIPKRQGEQLGLF